MVKWGESISRNQVLIDKDELHKLKQDSAILDRIKDAFHANCEADSPWHPYQSLSIFGNKVEEILYDYLEEEL